MGFCGDFKNHAAHTVEHPSGKSYYCEGVDREEVKETIVEKYSPEVRDEDGTAYSKVTIFIERSDGSTDILQCEKASAEMLEVEHEKYVALDYATKNFSPEIRRATFSFTPKKDEETGVAFTIERKDKNGNPR